MKRLLPIVFIVLTAAAWLCTVQAGMKGPKEKKAHLEAAQNYEEQGLYLSAIDEYIAARKYTKEDFNIKQKIIELYEKLDDEETCIQLCRQVIQKNPDRPETYEKLLKYYSNQENNRKLIPFIYTAMEAFPENTVFQEKFKELEKQYEIVDKGFESLSEYRDGLAVAERFKELGDEGEVITEDVVVNNKGFKEVEKTWPEIRLTDKKEEFLVKKADGMWEVVNTEGYTLANNRKVTFEDVGWLSQGYGSAVIDGKYHIINRDLKVSKTSWDYLSCFNDGFGAVRKGGKWAVFGLDGMAETTDYEFDDIKINNYGYAYVNGCIAAEKDGKYWFVDKTGKKLFENGFEDVKQFEGTQATAVMDKGKWGFMNKRGEMYLEPQYEDARPFSNGYAPVKKDGLWGYINRDNEMVIEPQFLEAGNVTEEGVAPVRGEMGWDVLRLYILYYKK